MLDRGPGCVRFVSKQALGTVLSSADSATPVMLDVEEDAVCQGEQNWNDGGREENTCEVIVRRLVDARESMAEFEGVLVG